jgi:hypothetical protein
MRFIGPIFASFLIIVAGIVMGTVPIIKDNLHWNFFFVIPISGLILGAAFGWTQFQISRLSGARVGGMAAVILALTCTVGYLATDLGQYWSMAAIVETGEGVGEGVEVAQEIVPLSELMTFQEFLRSKLETSSIDMRPGSSMDATVEVGSTAATVSFFADLLGSWLGALGALILGAEGAPYCRRCRRYKKGVATNEVPLDDETAVETVDRLQDSVQSGGYEAVVSLLNEVAKRPRPAEANIKISTDERVCPSCNEATMVCRVMRLEGVDGWNEALSLEVTSNTGSTARLDPMA